MNTQVQSSTEVSPTEMIFGSSVNHDEHFLTTPGSTTRDEPPHEYIKDLMQIQERTIRIAQDQEQHDMYVIAKRSQNNSYTTHFLINSYVLVQYETHKTTKLRTNKHGPYRVINHNGTIYVCEHFVTKEIKIVT